MPLQLVALDHRAHAFGSTGVDQVAGEQLDLLISVDTSVCHLAGALGTPVWLLNRANTCWRWQLERSDTPWYRNFRIFRQANTGDWNDVIAEVRTALLQQLG